MIERLRIVNFKCFADQALRCGPLTLLSGVNGLGKSSVLQALLLLRQSHRKALLQSEGLALNGDLVHIGTAIDALFEGAAEDSLGFDVEFSVGRKAMWRFRYSDPSKDVMESIPAASVPEGIYKASLFGDRFHYLQAERIAPKIAFEMSNYLVQQHKQLGTRGEYAAEFLSVFGTTKVEQSILRHDHATSSELRHQVEAWIGEICPGTRLHVTPNRGLDLIGLEYSFEIEKQVTRPFRSTNVGFGITYVLPIIVAALSSMPGSLLLVENPEAHLHPRGQAKVGELLARAAEAGIQVMVESHSDHVLNGIRLSVCRGLVHSEKIQLHYFSRDDRGHLQILAPKIDGKGRIDTWPQGFFDEWDKSLEGLIDS